MGSSGDGPEGLQQRFLKTVFLRAPVGEFAMLAQGAKTELRSKPTGVLRYYAPQPVVLYARAQHAAPRSKLMVLTDFRHERLFDISKAPASLAAECCEDYAGFKRYWRARTHRPFLPMDEVSVFRLAPWDSDFSSSAVLGHGLLERLYCDYL